MSALKDSILRELHRLASHKTYLLAMVGIPVFMALFFVSLLDRGLPEHVPTAIVDLDHSALSRTMTRSLGALSLVEIVDKYDSYDEALTAVRKGEIFGFFIIPRNFERDAVRGNKPTIEYFSNLTYFVPGTLAFKGFKTVAVTTAGGVVRSTLVSMGATSEQISGLLQPVVIDQHPIGNPWSSYMYYLCPSFAFCVLSMMVMLMTVYSITSEIKHGTSVGWLATAGNRISTALTGKLLPQTVIFFAAGLFNLWMMIGYSHFPQNGSLGWLILATLLLVVASQAFALLVCSLLPNPRLAFSVTALLSILSFSFAGFSYPVQSMYGAIGIFSYIAPIRYYFLIYLNQALNGFDVYYVRYYFAALLAFPLIGGVLISRLKRACTDPVYVP